MSSDGMNLNVRRITTNILCRFEDIFLSQISFRIRIINSRHFCPLPFVVEAIQIMSNYVLEAIKILKNV